MASKKPFRCRIGLHRWELLPYPNGLVTMSAAWVFQSKCKCCPATKRDWQWKSAEQQILERLEGR